MVRIMEAYLQEVQMYEWLKNVKTQRSNEKNKVSCDETWLLGLEVRTYECVKFGYVLVFMRKRN
jgi:hypothetical protein